MNDSAKISFEKTWNCVCGEIHPVHSLQEFLFDGRAHGSVEPDHPPEAPQVSGDYGSAWVMEVRRRKRKVGTTTYPATPWLPSTLYVHECNCQRAADRESTDWLEYRAREYTRVEG